jgi:hypothetical protein
VAEMFDYDINWRAGRQYPGCHRSWPQGGGLEFRGHAPLLDVSDARRIDLLASLKDPLERWIARTYRQRSAITLYVLADLSASMGVEGQRRKVHVLADLAESVAASAHRSGDAFGFIGADETAHEGLLVPATRTAGIGVALGTKLRDFVPTGASASGLQQAASWLPLRRSLVFLVSDLHFPLASVDTLLAALSRHAVVPCVVWDRAEFSPRFGLRIHNVRDPETGETRTLLMRPALRRALAASFRRRYRALRNLFLHRDMQPLLLTDGFRAELLTRYFAKVRPADLPQGL